MRELADVEASLARLPAAAPSPALVIEVQEPGLPTRKLELTAPVLRVGTDDRSAVKLAAAGVGRMHALIELREGTVGLIDLGSAPTSVNGVVVTHATLRPGDVIQLGEATLEVVSVPG